MTFIRLILAGFFSLLPTTFACTIGAFSPQATTDRTPVLWKNRDVDNPDQEVRFFAGGRYRFIANIYAGESARVWAGINEAGFAIMNSNSYNLGGRKSGDDDGTVMHLALANCASVDEFCSLMDSLNVVGRTTPANFGVFDSLSTTLVVEASNTFYKVYDAATDSHGFTLRANYSFSGDTIRLRGRNRWLRAMELCVTAKQQDAIRPHWIVGTLSRDLGQKGFNPYPLPFSGRFGLLDSGYLPTDSTICRRSTRSTEIMVGRAPGTRVGSSMMWVLLGSPDVSLPIPLWVAAGRVPEALDGPVHSTICEEAQRLHSYIRSDPRHPTAVNTYSLSRVLAWFAPVESTIFALVDSAIATWPGHSPTQEQAIALSESVCALVMATYAGLRDSLNPERSVTMLMPSVFRLTNRRMHLPLPNSSPVRDILIFDVSGRQVDAIPVAPGSSSVWYDPAHLPAGTYFLLLSAPPHASVQKTRLSVPGRSRTAMVR